MNKKVANELLKLARELVAKVDMGRIVTTRGVSEDMRDDPAFDRLVSDSLRRHSRGDWGDLHGGDRKQNDQALKNGDDRLFSVYNGGSEGKIWIITEEDRSVTTVLYPSEY